MWVSLPKEMKHKNIITVIGDKGIKTYEYSGDSRFMAYQIGKQLEGDGEYMEFDSVDGEVKIDKNRVYFVRC